MKSTLIKGGRIVDPSQRIDRVADLLIEDGRVSGIDDRISGPDGGDVIDAIGVRLQWEF